MDHRVTEKIGDLQSNTHETQAPIRRPSSQYSATGISIRPENTRNFRGHASLSAVKTSCREGYVEVASPADNNCANENLLVRDQSQPETEGLSSEGSSTSDTITQSAPAVLGTSHRTSESSSCLASSHGGSTGVAGGASSSDNSINEDVTGLEGPSTVGDDAIQAPSPLLSSAQLRTGEVNSKIEYQSHPLAAQQTESQQKEIGLEKVPDFHAEVNNKNGLNERITKQTEDENCERRLCADVDEDIDGVLVFGPCGEWCRWPHSRRVSIEKRPEGFGFTLRNVVAYPSHIHKIATSLGKRPKDIEPWWVEGKPLDAVVVREVRECGAAQAAGLQPHDRIVAHRGSLIESYAKFVAHIHQCSSVLDLAVVSALDDPLLQSGLLAVGAGGGMSRSVAACRTPLPGSMDSSGATELISAGIGFGHDVVAMQRRSHWLSSSLAPRPYLSSYPRETTSASAGPHFHGDGQRQQQLKSLQLVHSSPINQSTDNKFLKQESSNNLPGAILK